MRDPGRRDAAFVALADRHLDRAYRLARAILRDPVEAQDATRRQPIGIDGATTIAEAVIFQP